MQNSLNKLVRMQNKKRIIRVVILIVLGFIVLFTIVFDYFQLYQIYRMRKMYSEDSPEYYLMSLQLSNHDLAQKSYHYQETEHFLIGFFGGIGEENGTMYTVAQKTEKGYMPAGGLQTSVGQTEYIQFVQLYATTGLDSYLIVVMPMPDASLTEKEKLFLNDMQVLDERGNEYEVFEAGRGDKCVHYYEYDKNPGRIELFARTKGDSEILDKIGGLE